MNIGLISKKKIAELLSECAKNSGMSKNGYVVPDDSKVFYFDMGSQSVITYLKDSLHIELESEENNGDDD